MDIASDDRKKVLTSEFKDFSGEEFDTLIECMRFLQELAATAEAQAGKTEAAPK